ncbi:M15 family metallopeptidase [Angustibacter luteus]|uniref:M15 family metallopeptidase n=1 Tax=Angustibacter luteus TaxID=658456 RepID=A0ABW1JI44_9ACTN
MPPATRSTTGDRLFVDWTSQEPASEYRGRRRAPGAAPEPTPETDRTADVEVTDVIDRTTLVHPEPSAPAAPQYRTRAEAKAARLAEARPTTTVLPATRSRRSVAAPPAAPQPASRPSPNVRRAPHSREQPAPRTSRHRGLAVVGALAAVAGLGGLAVAAGALPSEAAGQAAASLGATTSASGGVLSDSSQLSTQLSTQQSSSRLAGGTLDNAFRMTAVSRSQERGAIAGCSGRTPTQSYSNGQLPTSILCVLPWASRHRLRADAAVRLIRLNEVYRGTFGEDLCLTDSYRSLASQYSVAARKPGLAARPGTSEHGWGLAIDVCDGPDQTSSARRTWFLANAPKFGWDNPAWARPGTGSRPEPWHWEFVEGESKTQSGQD